MRGYSAPTGDDLARFDSGEPHLDEYLRKQILAARTLYTHFDFTPSPTDPLHLPLIKDARALIEP